ncbi:MAG: ARMT1-like domain-containing protein [Nautiliaceae bacterium]
MKISRECYLCIYTQTLNLTKRLKLDENKASEILRGVAKILSKYDLNVTPPEIAAEVYDFISESTGIKDPFYKAKKEAINDALKFKKILEEKLINLKNPLFDACKIAVAGNVIDLGVNQTYDLDKEIENIFDIEFKHSDFNELKNKLNSAKSIVYLGDNAGENVFDEILIKQLRKYANTIYFFTRGKPIINDITVNDLKDLEIFDLAEVVDSGVDTPGFHINRANEKAKKLFFNADLVIAKGMGNFECLFGECGREVFYLFKVKCEVVARACGADVGEYVLLKGVK